MLPCIAYETDDFLIALKPAGVNTHAPSPFHGEGLYEILRSRTPKWAALSILHRLDKETSGLMVFGKTPEANRSLTRQFTEGKVQKTYSFLSDKDSGENEFEVRSFIRKSGSHFLSANRGEKSEAAHTVFRKIGKKDGFFRYEAEPRTGKTHQIRLHAAERGIPVLGDSLYGGSSYERVCLHAERLEFLHPRTERKIGFKSSPEFSITPAQQTRMLLIDPEETSAYRLIHGAADGWPGLFVDKVGEFLLATSSQDLDPKQKEVCQMLTTRHETKGLYFKNWLAKVPSAKAQTLSPALAAGSAAPGQFELIENKVRYCMSFEEGYSIGLFLDQRENRGRVLRNWVGPNFPLDLKSGSQVLNLFAYTCGFSVCAALSGATVTSIDLSKKYLDWGRRNFEANQLDSAEHDFIFGDVFSWVRKFEKRGRKFDLVIVDPPTFSRSKESGVFQAQKDYSRLVTAILPLLRPGGVLFCSSNAADLEPEEFLAQIEEAFTTSGRKVELRHYVPQPVDFPVTRDEPAYLKTVWYRVR